MPSFKATSNSFDDEEFFMLSDLFEWKNVFLLHKDYSTFNLNEMTESECLSEFRFGKRHSDTCHSCFPYKVYFPYIMYDLPYLNRYK